MKKFIRIFLMIAAVLLLLGSFPIRHYWGQMPCDIVRVIGFALVFIILFFFPDPSRSSQKKS